MNSLVYDFFRFHHDNFRDTISWECIVKDYCITSCLIELQSFSLSKLYIDPIHRVLVPFPLLLELCKTRLGQVKLARIFVFLVHGIHSRVSLPREDAEACGSEGRVVESAEEENPACRG